MRPKDLRYSPDGPEALDVDAWTTDQVMVSDGRGGLTWGANVQGGVTGPTGPTGPTGTPATGPTGPTGSKNGNTYYGTLATPTIGTGVTLFSYTVSPAFTGGNVIANPQSNPSADYLAGMSLYLNNGILKMGFWQIGSAGQNINPLVWDIGIILN